MRNLLLLSLALSVLFGCEKKKDLALDDPDLKPAKEVASQAKIEPPKVDDGKLRQADIEQYPGAKFEGEPVWKLSTAAPDDPGRTIDSYTSRMNTTDPLEKVVPFYEKRYAISSNVAGKDQTTLFGKNKVGDVVVTISKTATGSTINIVVSTGGDLDTSRKRDVPLDATSTTTG